MDKETIANALYSLVESLGGRCTAEQFPGVLSELQRNHPTLTARELLGIAADPAVQISMPTLAQINKTTVKKERKKKGRTEMAKSTAEIVRERMGKNFTGSPAVLADEIINLYPEADYNRASLITQIHKEKAKSRRKRPKRQVPNRRARKAGQSREVASVLEIIDGEIKETSEKIAGLQTSLDELQQARKQFSKMSGLTIETLKRFLQ